MRKLTLGLICAVLLASSPAHGQVPNFPQTVPSNTVIGRLSPNSGPTEAIPISRLFNNILATPIRQLTINTLGGTARGLSITHGGMSGTCTDPSGCSYNLIYIPSDVVVSTGQVFNVGLNIFHQFGGSAMTGGREAFQATANLIAPSSASNANRNYVGAELIGQATTGDGGTNTGAGAQGAIFGYSGWARALNGATNLLNVSGGEINVGVETGASTKYKSGLSIVQHMLDRVAGASLDTSLAISSQGNGATGQNTGIAFGDFATGQPVKTTGTLIGIVNPNGSTTAVAQGVDLSTATFTGCAFKSTGFCVDNAGNITATSFSAGTGIAAVANGGTGRSTLANHSVLVGANTTAITQIGVGANGTLLLGQTAADPAFNAMSGDATIAASGTLTIGTNVVTNAKAAQMAPNTIKGNNTGGTANAADLTVAQTQALVSYPIVQVSTTVDFNSANTDFTITIASPTTNYKIQSIVVINSGTTASLTTARAGVFSGAGGTGTTIVADAVLSALTSNTVNVSGSSANLATIIPAWLNFSTIFFRVSTAQGAAATGKVYVFIQPLP